MNTIYALLVSVATFFEVPAPIIGAVCFVESGFRDRNALCGYPTRLARGPEAQVRAAARRLRQIYETNCGRSWPRTIQFYHTGSCRLTPCSSSSHRHGSIPYGERVMSVSRGRQWREVLRIRLSDVRIDSAGRM